MSTMTSLPSGRCLSAPTLSRPPLSAGRLSVRRSRASGRHRPADRRRLLSEELFKDTLMRERRRADRFEEAFALVLISLDNCPTPQSRWRQLVECLLQTASDADLMGWLEQDAVLGVIRVLGDSGPTDTTAAAVVSIEQDILRCLSVDAADNCSIRLEIYSPKSDAISPVVFDGLKPRPTPKQVARDAAKRALDIAGSLAFLLAFSPLFLCISVLVKLSSKGPVIFRQQRLGIAGRAFPMLKFRTMQVNADPRIHQQYVEQFIASQDKSKTGNAVVFKIVNDPRVTRLGRFLRRSSLDELPQFWNVLRGEMSLVGPRPPVPYEMARYKRWHRRRVLEAKPGITGLWQVTGRSRTTFDEMVRLDLRYAKSYSLWTDVKILLATPRAVLSGRGAY